MHMPKKKSISKKNELQRVDATELLGQMMKKINELDTAVTGLQSVRTAYTEEMFDFNDRLHELETKYLRIRKK